MAAHIENLIDAAARPYLTVGRSTYHFVRSKLKYDSFFLELLRTRTIPPNARILDLGCGHAIIAALLLAARQKFEAGDWPDDWPEPPADPRLHGFESEPGVARRARTSLAGRATIDIADLREAPFPPSDLILLIDVLHYLDAESQKHVLDKAVAALQPAGAIVLRIANPSAGWKFYAGRAADHFGSIARGRMLPRHHHRDINEWRDMLGERGLDARIAPTQGKPSFANVLLQATA